MISICHPKPQNEITLIKSNSTDSIFSRLKKKSALGKPLSGMSIFKKYLSNELGEQALAEEENKKNRDREIRRAVLDMKKCKE